VAYLWTGQVFAPGVRETGFGSVEKLLRRAGAGGEEIERLHLLWEATPEFSHERYESIVTLLRVFARQLGDKASGLLLAAAPQEPEAVRRARYYVRDNLGERMTLEEIAQHAGLSQHHFSRLFRSATGLTLTDYINRSRIEAARQLLLKADARVSEVAFEVGYQSLSQFNRSFLRITGRSPLDYRRQILRPEVVRRAS
jgi:AraC-like DNA-binding protein